MKTQQKRPTYLRIKERMLPDRTSLGITLKKLCPTRWRQQSQQFGGKQQQHFKFFGT